MILSYRLRLLFLGMVIVGSSALLMGRLWHLQIEKNQEYIDKLPGTSTAVHRLAGTRGRILDRNGNELARNKTTLQISLDLGAVVKRYRELHKGVLPEYEWKPGKKEPDIFAIYKDMVLQPMQELGLAPKYDEEQLRIHYRTNAGEIPYVLAEDVDWKIFAQFAEHSHKIPGLIVSQRALREYPYGALGGHLLGYVRQFDKDIPEADRKMGFKFYEGDDYGVAGLEKTLDPQLRGKPGTRSLLVNEHGRLEGEIKNEPPRPGDDVYLTMDIRIQYIAEMALRDGGVGRGAVVVMNPNSGEVLAMVSLPSFDPGKFIPRISQKEFELYRMDKTDPLLNRAISGYAPGSTFKILTALSGFLAPGKMAHGYTCNNYVEYGNRAFPCWTVQKSMGGHGWLDLTGGIQRSCNCFFYQYGNDAGIENIGKMTRMIGLGTSTGVELEGENPGLIPGPAWLKASSGERWSSARTANVSIGQGEVLASPLQMCMVASTVANGQFSYVPTLVHHREDRSTGTKTKFLPKVRQDLLKEGVKRQQMELLRSGMRKVVNEPGGTGSNFRSQIPDIAEHGGGAGKTGTAQFKRAGKKDNHTWFICFAPYENPKVACCIFVQGGNSGGGCAAPVARRVVEQTLSLESGAYRVDPKAIGRMGEAKGHFNFIEAVKYPGENVPDAPVDDVDTDDSNAREVDDAPIKVKAVPAEPTFKSETQKEAPKARPVERPKYQTNTPP